MWPTAPMFTRTPLHDTVVAGRYAFPKDTALSILVPMLHRDRSVWGADAEEFNPDHFRPERFKSLPPNAYRPFGTGMRACIGRQFALQEATLVLGMLLQRFEFIDHRDYQLRTLATLTVKPADFWIKLRAPTKRCGSPSRRPAQWSNQRRTGRSDVRPPPVMARRCWCSSGRIWEPPKASPTDSAEREWSAATRSPSPRSTTTAPSCQRRAPCSSCAPPTTESRRRMRPRSWAGSARRHWLLMLLPASLTPCSVAATPIGPQRIRRCRSYWTRASSGTAHADSSARRGECERRFRRPVPSVARRIVVRRRDRTSAPDRVGRAAADGSAAVHLDRQPIADQPCRALLRGDTRPDHPQRGVDGKRVAGHPIHPSRGGVTARRHALSGR